MNCGGKCHGVRVKVFVSKRTVSCYKELDPKTQLRLRQSQAQRLKSFLKDGPANRRIYRALLNQLLLKQTHLKLVKAPRGQAAEGIRLLGPAGQVRRADGIKLQVPKLKEWAHHEWAAQKANRVIQVKKSKYRKLEHSEVVAKQAPARVLQSIRDDVGRQGRLHFREQEAAKLLQSKRLTAGRQSRQPSHEGVVPGRREVLRAMEAAFVLPLSNGPRMPIFGEVPFMEKQLERRSSLQIKRQGNTYQSEAVYFSHEGGVCSHCKFKANYIVLFADESSERGVRGVTFCSWCLQQMEAHDFQACSKCMQQLVGVHGEQGECRECEELFLAIDLKNLQESGTLAAHELSPHNDQECNVCAIAVLKHLRENHSLNNCDFCNKQWSLHRKAEHLVADCFTCGGLFQRHLVWSHPMQCTVCERHSQSKSRLQLRQLDLEFCYDEEDEGITRGWRRHIESKASGSEQLTSAIQFYFQQSLGRPPSQTELKSCIQLVRSKVLSQEPVDLSSVLAAFTSN